MFDTLTTNVLNLFRASLPIVVIDNPTTEERSMLEALATQVAGPLSWPLFAYDETYSDNAAGRLSPVLLGEDSSGIIFGEPEFAPEPGNALLDTLDYIAKYDGVGIFVLVDIGGYLSGDRVNPWVIRTLKTLSFDLRTSFKRVVIMCPNLVVPEELTGVVTELSNALPDAEAVRVQMDYTLNDLAKFYTRDGFKVELSQDDAQRLLRSCQGLTLREIEDSLRLAEVADGRIDSTTAERVNSAKIQKLQKLNVEFCGKPNVEAAGLDQLKTWIMRKGNRFHNPSPDRPAPKGLMLVGVPGSGKSLIAKTIGTLWNVPVLSVDMGAIYGSLVGQSESNLRQLLSHAEAIAPCVLFIDEIEKALAGVSSANDSGVSQRLFGKLLSWMQEKTAQVFVVATANNIQGLPPEFTRKGRFDEVFFVDLPNDRERLAILEAHLDRFGVVLSESDKVQVTEATQGFSGAELGAVVEEALDAMDMDDNDTLSLEYLLDTARVTVPLSRRDPDTITALRTWATVAARNASTPVKTPAPPSKAKTKAKVAMLG